VEATTISPKKHGTGASSSWSVAGVSIPMIYILQYMRLLEVSASRNTAGLTRGLDLAPTRFSDLWYPRLVSENCRRSHGRKTGSHAIWVCAIAGEKQDRKTNTPPRESLLCCRKLCDDQCDRAIGSCRTVASPPVQSATPLRSRTTYPG
jgi:hypothetical protein